MGRVPSKLRPRARKLPGVAQDPELAGRVLVVDDERNIRRALRMLLEGEGVDVEEAETAEAALERLRRDPPVETVLMDVRLPGMDGITAMQKMAAKDGTLPCPVIMISGHASLEEAVRATHLGSFDFFEKPLDRARVLVSVRNALRQYAAERELARLRAQVRRALVGESPALRALLDQISKVGPTKARVLITGESGTGKELVARALHGTSHRRDGPFVAVNCAAIPSELLESELFGHEKGAFTGAIKDRPGRFELAEGGTLFLDEIGDLALGLQAKLLRFLQEHTIERVGDSTTRHVDVRVIAATHVNLVQAVAERRFREDLYYRLRVVPIHIPPLRERRQDLELLIRHLLQKIGRERGRSLRLAPSASRALLTYSWPGNVRELESALEYATTVCEGQTIHVADLPAEVGHPSPEPAPGAPATPDTARSVLQLAPAGIDATAEEPDEVRRIREALAAAHYRRAEAAKLLGMSRTTLWRKMKEHRL